MTAAVLKGHGGLEELEVKQVAVPPVGESEVLIRVGACGVNNTDINTRTAWYASTVREGTSGEGFSEASGREDATWGGKPLSFPRIQGADVCGEVAVGPERLLGRRVVVDPWLRDWSTPTDRTRAGFFGSECDGGFAQFVKVPVEQVHAVESDWSDAELATFPCAYVTAENMLTRARLAQGERLLVTGASGGVGSALVQLAKTRGAFVVALASAAKLDRLRDVVGTDLALPTGSALDDQSFDVVADVVGGAALFPSLLASLKRGGRYVTAGAIAGPIVDLDLRTLYLKDLELIGATVPLPGVFPNLVAHISNKTIKPLLSQSYPLADIHRAQTDFLDKKFVGKLVLLPPPLP